MGTRFDVKWSLHLWLRDPYGRKGFQLETSGSSILVSDVSHSLRASFQFATRELPLTTEVRGYIERLWNEVNAIVSEPEPVVFEGVAVPTFDAAQHIVRTVRERGFERSWERRQSADEQPTNPPAVRKQISALSSAGLKAIRIIDGLARRDIANRFQQRKKELANGAIDPGAQAQEPIKVFVSYRKTDLGIARSLHRAFAEFGHGVHFEPFLDVHDTKLGDWAQQFLDAIDASDLFVAVCTPDYALPGSFALGELEHAVAVGVPLAVIVPGFSVDQLPAVWKDILSKCHACILKSPNDARPGEANLERYLATCAEIARRQ